MPVAAKTTKMQAVRTLYESLGGVPTPIYLDEAPEGTGWPRATMIDGGDVPDIRSFDEDENGTPTLTIGTFRIEIEVENDSDAAEAAAVVVMDAFRPEAIQLTGNPEARMFRRKYSIARAKGRSNNGKPLYVARIEYRIDFSTDY